MHNNKLNYFVDSSVRIKVYCIIDVFCIIEYNKRQRKVLIKKARKNYVRFSSRRFQDVNSYSTT